MPTIAGGLLTERLKKRCLKDLKKRYELIARIIKIATPPQITIIAAINIIAAYKSVPRGVCISGNGLCDLTLLLAAAAEDILRSGRHFRYCSAPMPHLFRALCHCSKSEWPWKDCLPARTFRERLVPEVHV